MIVSINQPAYLPWLGYFDRIAASDLHVVLDAVQFEKNSFTNRNKIRTATGWCWLTIPVETGGKFGDLAIMDVRIAGDGRWRQKHWRTIEQSYAPAAHFGEHRDAFADIYGRSWQRLIEPTTAINDHLLKAFGITTPLLYASTMQLTERKSALVLEICRRVGAKSYLSGPFGRDYLDAAAFAAAGIEILYHDYRHPTYLQAHPGFEPSMAAIDLLFNHGPRAGTMLRAGEQVVRPA